MKRIVEEGHRLDHSFETIRVELKEYLQYFVLDYLYNSDFKTLIFYGGSSLRILHGLPRMSEDLDFEAEEHLDFHAISKGLAIYFQSDLLMKKIKITSNKEKNIIRILLVFPIAHGIGLSLHKDETIKIKIEIRLVSDEYVKLVKSVFTPVSKYGKTFIIKHYDLSTLMAGKIAAILGRPEKGFHKGHPDEGIKFKGRDYYDLLWYMNKGILPNEKMFKVNGITKSTGEIFDKISVQISKMDIKGIQKDIENLFINQAYVNDFIRTFRDTFNRLKEKQYQTKKDLRFNAVFIGKHPERNNVLFFRFEFISPKRELVDFIFYLSNDFMRYIKGEPMQNILFSKKQIFWQNVEEKHKDAFLEYAAVFFKKIKDYLNRNHDEVYFEKWESKFIRIAEYKHNPNEEIIIMSEKELESDALRLEDLLR